MKTTKGLLLTLGLFLISLVGVEANSPSTDKVKDNIFTAIRTIDYMSINILLADGMDVDTVDRKGNTPLMVAAKIGNPRILDIILSHNPDINKTNKQGVTALMVAAESGQLHAVKKLISRGANPDIRDNRESTALAMASKFGHEQIAEYLKNL